MTRLRTASTPLLLLLLLPWAGPAAAMFARPTAVATYAPPTEDGRDVVGNVGSLIDSAILAAKGTTVTGGHATDAVTLRERGAPLGASTILFLRLIRQTLEPVSPLCERLPYHANAPPTSPNPTF